MDWGQELFVAFMIAVVGNLFAISTFLIWSPRKPEIKPKRRQKRKRYPICDLRCCPYRMELDLNKREAAQAMESINDPTDSQTGRREDEAPPVR